MIEFKVGALKKTTVPEYAIRFLFGGATTALAGVIANRYGAGIGGLFLAYPAIFPGSISLIEKHERERKQEIGSNGARRARLAAASDAAGAAIGAVGLALFACLVWQGLCWLNRAATISLAAAAWCIAAIALWKIRKRRFFLRKKPRSGRDG